MKNFKKQISLIGLSLLGTACLLSGTAIAYVSKAQADTATLEQEFTNNGQLKIAQYSTVAYDFVDGASENLPAGYEGAVLRVNSEGGAGYVNLDLSASKILATDVESIVVRAYSPDYTSTDDEFRTTSMAGELVQYGVGAYDMSTWCDITLKATSIAGMTDANGYLTSITLGLRDKGTISKYFYIDSICVNMKQTTKVTFDHINVVWNNYVYDNGYCTFFEFNGGISGNGNLNANFSGLISKMTLNGAAVDANNVKFYCPNWIGASGGIVMRLATNPSAGSVLKLPAGAKFDIGGTDTTLYEITEDAYFQFDGAVWNVCEKPVDLEDAVFTGVWDTMNEYNSAEKTLLKFSSNQWDYTDKGDLAMRITYKNSETGATYQATNDNLIGWGGQQWIVLQGLTGYDVIEIAAGGSFGGVEIPAITVYNINGHWTTKAPSTATTNYVDIAGGWNNLRTEGKSQTILKFDVNPLGNGADATNLAATVNTTSLMVSYNGKTFAELFADTTNVNYAQYHISYAHANQYFYFAIPEADLVDGAIFKIENGTPFMNNYLPSVQLKYSASTQTWESVLELVYGTPNFGVATAAGVGSWGWNHQTGNDAVIKDSNYGYTIISDWAMSGSENLAQTENVTSRSITLNGVSFYDLYQMDDGYRLNAQLGYFAFSVPTSALVASNGYEYPTIEIVEGTPFYAGNYLPKTTIIYKDGAWQLKAEEIAINYNPDYVKIGTLNHSANDGLQAYGLSLIYNTVGFAEDGQQIMPASSTGFTLNGEEVRPALWGNDQLLFWLGMAKCEAGYNGYSHATLEIAEGAKIVNVSGGEFTFKALTMYLVNGAWTTAKPADYTVTVIDTTNYNPEFVEMGTLNHYDNNAHWGLSLVYNTTGFTADGQQVMADSSTGFTINGEAQAVALWGGEQLLFWMKKEYCEPDYNGYSHATLQIAEGATVVNGNGKTFTFKALTVYLVNGAWTTEKPADYQKLQPTTFAGIGTASTKNSVTLTFADELVWNNNAGNLADFVLLDGVTPLSTDGGSAVADSANKTVTIQLNGNYSKLEIVVGGNIAGVIIPAISVYSTADGWSLKPQAFNTLTGIGVYGNNNRPAHEIYHTVLSYGNYFVYGGDDSVNDATNMASSADYDVANKIKLNGKTFYELYQEDYRFYVGYMSGGRYLTFQIPQEYLDGAPENGYEYHTIEIEEGTAFMDWQLPALTMISFDNVWMNLDGFNPEPLAYGGIPYGWNCMKSGMYIDTILQFGSYEFDPNDNSYLGDYLGEDNGTVSHADATNLALIDSEQIATKMTINGVPVKDISGVTVSYAHGYSLVYISVPVYELCPTEDYKCVVLHIEANTVFKKSVLGEVTLYLVDGQWQTEAPTTMKDDAEGTYLTAGDIFGGETSGYYADGVYTLTDADDNAEIISAAKATENGALYNFLYKSSAVDFDYSLFTGETDEFGGVRVTIYRNLGESTHGFNVYVNGALLGSKQSSFTEGEWYAIRIAIVAQDGMLSVSVAVDGVEVVYAETEYDGAIGETIKLKKSYGALTFADFRTGDIKLPTIHWQGKDVYRFSVGEAQPDNSKFMQVLSVTDNYDKTNFSTENIIVTWQDGAVQDGLLQVGEWKVTISVSDNAGNVAFYTVTALVTNPNEITVTLQANGATSYVINTKGELLTKPADPTKEGDEKVNYIFDGWYVGDKKWDFANDYTFENIELVAVFTVEYKEYTVTVVSEGLANGYTYTFELRYGSTLDAGVFERDGYTYKLMNGNEEINEITVDGEMQIKVVYTANPVEPDSGNDSVSSDSNANDSTSNSTSKKSSCSGDLNGVVTYLALALAVAVVFARKGGKENE